MIDLIQDIEARQDAAVARLHQYVFAIAGIDSYSETLEAFEAGAEIRTINHGAMTITFFTYPNGDKKTIVWNQSASAGFYTED